MRRSKYFLLLVCCVTLALSAGCETTKGVAIGVAATTQGMGQDTRSLWSEIKKADTWMREHLW